MKSAIKEFIELTDAEKKNLWDKAIFIFDTNIYLNLYRYSKKTRDSLLKAMQGLENKIWMPKQVAYEFMKDRVGVIISVMNSYDSLKNDFSTFAKKVSEELRLNKDDKDIKRLEEFFEKWITSKKETNIAVSDLHNDTILSQILELYDGKVGTGFDKDDMDKIIAEGEERVKKHIPPAYKDSKKADATCDNNAYGDFVIWKEIINYAKDNKRDVIFITDDKKEDWWNICKGRTIGPRVELIKEFSDITNQEFYMYSMEQFISVNDSINGKKIDTSVIDEVKRVPRLRRIERERSLSMGMERLAFTERKIDELREKMNYLSDKLQYSRKEIEEAIDSRDIDDISFEEKHKISRQILFAQQIESEMHECDMQIQKLMDEHFRIRKMIDSREFAENF